MKHIITLEKDVSKEDVLALVGKLSEGEKRPLNPRIFSADIDEQKLAELKDDPRVLAVENPLLATLTEDVTQESARRFPRNTEAIEANWGTARHLSDTNPFAAMDTTISTTFERTYDGTGVDVIIMEVSGHGDPAHFEFANPDGSSRVVTVDWQHYFPAGETYTPGGEGAAYHGFQVTLSACGNTNGYATRANIIYAKYGEFIFDAIIAWHEEKMAGGSPRPTVINMSFGYTWSVDNVDTIHFRGSSFRTSRGKPLSEKVTSLFYDFGLPHSPTAPYDFMKVETQQMVDAGIHVVAAAGNAANKIDVEGGLDYDNFFRYNYEGYEDLDFLYCRASVGDGVIVVGALNSVFGDRYDGEIFAPFSTRGTRVDCVAAGDAVSVYPVTRNFSKYQAVFDGECFFFGDVWQLNGRDSNQFVAEIFEGRWIFYDYGNDEILMRDTLAVSTATLPESVDWEWGFHTIGTVTQSGATFIASGFVTTADGTSHLNGTYTETVDGVWNNGDDGEFKRHTVGGKTRWALMSATETKWRVYFWDVLKDNNVTDLSTITWVNAVLQIEDIASTAVDIFVDASKLCITGFVDAGLIGKYESYGVLPGAESWRNTDYSGYGMIIQSSGKWNLRNPFVATAPYLVGVEDPQVLDPHETTWTAPPAPSVSLTVTPSIRGTSFSSPFVAGMIACVLQRWPTATPSQIHRLVKYAMVSSETMPQYSTDPIQIVDDWGDPEYFEGAFATCGYSRNIIRFDYAMPDWINPTLIADTPVDHSAHIETQYAPPRSFVDEAPLSIRAKYSIDEMNDIFDAIEALP